MYVANEQEQRTRIVMMRQLLFENIQAHTLAHSDGMKESANRFCSASLKFTGKHDDFRTICILVQFTIC